MSWRQTSLLEKKFQQISLFQSKNNIAVEDVQDTGQEAFAKLHLLNSHGYFG